MASPARLILETLDRHLTGRAHIRLLGGAALILGYGRNRSTEDVELEPQGLYLTHIWGPEQQILTRSWRSDCRELALGFERLTVSVLGPVDLICSKLARADDLDLDDVEWLVRSQKLSPEVVLKAAHDATVPEVLAETWAAALPRLKSRLGATG